jgi:hypothetical protein
MAATRLVLLHDSVCFFPGLPNHARELGYARAVRLGEIGILGRFALEARSHRLLAFSRQQPLAPKPIDANKLVSELASFCAGTGAKRCLGKPRLPGGLWRTHAFHAERRQGHH